MPKRTKWNPIVARLREMMKLSEKDEKVGYMYVGQSNEFQGTLFRSELERDRAIMR